MYTIYAHTCRLNGKRYVGWTALTSEERWREHIADTRRESSQHRLFKQALVKHGVENWDHDVLEVCDSEAGAQLAEIKWIALLKTNALREDHVGYNMTDGGEGHLGPHSEDTKRAISKGLMGNMCGTGGKGRTWTPEQRARIAAALKGRKRSELECQAVSDGMQGHKVSDETKQRIADSQRGRRCKNHRSRAVQQFTTSGQILATHVSVGAAFESVVGREKALQYVNCSSAARYTIVRCCDREREDAYGYVWRWA